MRSLILAIIVLPSVSFAGTWTAPEGCEVFMTVQAKGCRVSNHYRCEADPAGDQWRADFDQEGLFFQSRIDSEAQWVESLEDRGRVRQTLDPGPADPASFSELLSSGLDTFDFALSRTDGANSAVTGFDRLTGETVVIDGIELKRTEFEATEVDGSGNVLRRNRGNEYIHPEWRLFFSGPSEWDPGDGTFLPLDGSPIDFIFPGEPGFQKTQPLYDCDAIMSFAPAEGADGHG
ncbi:MAG: hypothetical protein HC844_01760 [Tabrizicola sp.]|nr:hypothetical protein [Tabrizicola sp.]